MSFGQARALVIGLDAATFDVITPLLQAGQLPTLARLMEEGSHGVLQSTIPPLSPAAWVSAITGKNPGKHGIFDFRHLDLNAPHGRKETLASATEYAGMTIFDYLGKRGMRVGAFHIPLTYPAWPINGIMVSGPVTPDHRRAYTYPPDLSEEIGPLARHQGPEQLEGFDDEAYLEELIWNTETHFRIGARLLEQKGPFDLFWFHLHSLDSVQHRFWRYAEATTQGAKDKPMWLADAINHLYRLADEGVRLLLDRVGPDTLVYVISDHGAMPRPSTELCVNVWLQMRGYQTTWGQSDGEGLLRTMYRRAKSLLPSPLRQRLIGELPTQARQTIAQFSSGGIKWSHTIASFFPLADPIGGIVINLTGRNPKGIVRPEEYEAVRQQIIHDLSTLMDPTTGQAVVEQIWRREEIYTGPHMESAPDILFRVARRYHLSNALEGSIIYPTLPIDTKSWSGIHTMEGILIAKAPFIRSRYRVESARLIDIAPTILYALGLPIPADLDGRVLTEIFLPEFVEDHPILNEEPISSPDPHDPHALSKEEAAAMVDRLRMLGYIE